MKALHNGHTFAYRPMEQISTDFFAYAGSTDHVCRNRRHALSIHTSGRVMFIRRQTVAVVVEAM